MHPLALFQFLGPAWGTICTACFAVCLGIAFVVKAKERGNGMGCAMVLCLGAFAMAVFAVVTLDPPTPTSVEVGDAAQKVIARDLSGTNHLVFDGTSSVSECDGSRLKFNVDGWVAYQTSVLDGPVRRHFAITMTRDGSYWSPHWAASEATWSDK